MNKHLGTKRRIEMFATLIAALIIVMVIVLFITFPQCSTEDSAMCYWSASKQGNGLGRSFISLWDGITIFIGA